MITTSNTLVTDSVLNLFPEAHANALRPLVEVGAAIERMLAPHTRRQMQALGHTGLPKAECTQEEAARAYALLMLHPSVIAATCRRFAEVLPIYAKMRNVSLPEDVEGKTGTVKDVVHAARMLQGCRIDQVIDLGVSVLKAATDEVDTLMGIEEHLTSGEIRVMLFSLVPTLIEFYFRFTLNNAETFGEVAEALTKLKPQDKETEKTKKQKSQKKK